MRNPFKKVSGCTVKVREPLSRHTSFHIGGPALFLVTVFSCRALEAIMECCRKEGLSICVIGAGTNVLFQDSGYKGVVVRFKGRFSSFEHDGALFSCGAGVKIDRLLDQACSLGYGGVDFLAGIPGTIGGAIYGNAGAFGRAISDIVKQVTIMTRQGSIHTLSRSDIRFDYRSSHLPRSSIVLSAMLRFKKGKKREIKRGLATRRMHRRIHQPKGWSAGSFFKNPKPLSAGKLIDECGFKGVYIGNAKVSTQHANWIINEGSATAHDVLTLSRIIKRKVKQKTGVLLKEEVRILK